MSNKLFGDDDDDDDSNTSRGFGGIPLGNIFGTSLISDGYDEDENPFANPPIGGSDRGDPLSSNGLSVTDLNRAEWGSRSVDNYQHDDTYRPLVDDPISGSSLSFGEPPITGLNLGNLGLMHYNDDDDSHHRDDILQAVDQYHDHDVNVYHTAGVMLATPTSYGDLLAPPPSYADSVMYSRPEIQHGTRVEIMASTAVSRNDDRDDGTLRVSVGDPKKDIDLGSSLAAVGKKVVHYKVTTVATLPGYSMREAMVWRRFRDFVALGHKLSESHRGYFVPPRPEKTVMPGLTDDMFVTHRSRQLNTYLHKLATHPVLRNSAELQLFLTCQDLGASYEWTSFRTGLQLPSSSAATASPPNGIGRPGYSSPLYSTSGSGGGGSKGIGRFFKELRQSVAQSSAVTALGGALGLETNKPKVCEEDGAFLTERDRVMRLEQELSIASQKAEKVLIQEDRFGDALGELGLTCVKLSKVEEAEAAKLGAYSANGSAAMALAGEMRRMGLATVRVSRLTRSATAQLAGTLDPLHDYLGMMPAVRRAVADRAETLLSLQTLLAEVDAKTNRIARLEAEISKIPDMHKARRVEDVRRDLIESRTAAEEAQREYGCIQGRQQEEFSRLEKERVEEFRKMLLGFARVNLAHTERTLTVWRTLAEELGANPNELSVGGTGFGSEETLP